MKRYWIIVEECLGEKTRIVMLGNTEYDMVRYL